MSPSDRTIAVPTGMIIAALYVILLIGFSRESYMRRDAAARLEALARIASPISDQACRMEQAACAVMDGDTTSRPICSVSIETLRRLFVASPER
jgi:hypothetical protein